MVHCLRSYRFLPLAGLFALALLACREQPNPRMVFEESARAGLAVQTARYSAVYTRLFDKQTDPVEVRGTILVQRYPDDAELGAKVLMEVERNGRKRTYAYDGASLRLLDPDAKTLTLAGPEVEGVRFISGNIIGNLVRTSLISPDPFAGALERADTIIYNGIATVAGIECHVLTLEFPDNEYFVNSSARWYLGVEDLLPRKYVAGYVYDGQNTQNTLEIRNLETGIPLSAENFAPTTPDGYRVEHYQPQKRPGLLEPGAAAPDFRLQMPDGSERSLADYRGKVVLLDFWGTWCVPCIKAMPALQKLHERYSDKGLAVVGISCRERPDADPAGFMERQGFTYDLFLGGDAVASAYQVSGFPTLYLIAKDGNIVYHSLGVHEDAERVLTALIESELARDPV